MASVTSLLREHSVPLQAARLLFEVGYDQPCLAYYFAEKFIDGNHTNVLHTLGYVRAAPLVSQARAWIEKQHGLIIMPYRTEQKMYNYFIFSKNRTESKGSLPQTDYLAAEKLAIVHSLIIIKQLMK